MINWKRLSAIVLLMLCHVLLHAETEAAVPQLINYNGSLTDSGGVPVPDGQYDVVFTIYDALTQGNVLWTETWNASTTKVITYGGNFNAVLGTYTPLPASFFADNSVTYLGVKVGADSEMRPRQRITSVGYAFAAGNGIPKGGIIMWSGAVDQIPAGWALCDGNNGTPNLRDRFVVGAGGSYNVSATGGEATHVLTANEMPSHTHVQNAHTHIQDAHSHTERGASGGQDTDNFNVARGSASADSYAGDYSGSIGITAATNQNTIAVNQNTGGSAAHENRPPYFAIAFIMKL